MRLTFIALAIAAGLSVIQPAQAEMVKDACRLNHAAVVTSTLISNTTETFFVDVPESGVRIVQGPGQPDCVVVSFSAAAASPQTQVLMVRALLDGVDCEPGAMLFARGDASLLVPVVRTVNFICTGVTPGIHRLKLQYRSSNGGMVSLHHRTLTVHHFR